MTNTYITIDEAIRSNNIVIGIAVLALVLIAAAAWIGVIALERKQQDRARKLAKKAEDKIRAEYDTKLHEKGVEMTGKWLDALNAKHTAETQAAYWKDRYDALRKEHDDLKRDAANCPAYGTVGKRGNA